MSLSWERSRAWILVLAGALRLLWALVVPMRPVSDGIAYLTFARNLAAGGAFGWDPAVPDAFWPPGAPFLYSLLLRAFGPDLESIVALNVLLSMAVIVLTMRLVRAWDGDRSALIAGLMLAIWPLQIQFVTVLSSELPFTVAMLLAFCAFGKPPNRWLGVVAMGVFMALAAYLRPTALLLPAGLALIVLWRRFPPIPVVAQAAGATIVMALLIAPWTARNFEVFDQFVPISANAGANLWMGNNPESVGEYMPVPKELKHLDRATQDAELRDRALDWMTQEPASALALMARKLVVTHSRETIGVAWNVEGLAERGLGEFGQKGMALLSTLYWYGILALALVGLVPALRRQGLGSFPAVFWIYFAAVHAITVAMDRYHIASIPFVAWLAAAAYEEWAPRLRSWAGAGRDLSDAAFANHPE
jgi:4-amino-4-deoxy-L-arabinose transferase-like glycosyltransferase